MYAKTQTDQALDAIIQALQNLPTWEIKGIDQSGVPNTWWNCSGPEIAEQLVIREHNLAFQVQGVSVQIFEWGRLAARAQRILAIYNRLYRAWKAKLIREKLESLSPGEKAPTEKVMEAIYQSHPDYDSWNERIEAATEAAASTAAVLEGFRAKSTMLKASIRPSQEAAFNPTLSLP